MILTDKYKGSQNNICVNVIHSILFDLTCGWFNFKNIYGVSPEINFGKIGNNRQFW